MEGQQPDSTRPMAVAATQAPPAASPAPGQTGQGNSAPDGPLPDGAYALKQFGAGSDLYQTNIPVQGGVAYTAAGQFYHSDIEDIIAKSALSTRMFLHVSWLDAECTPIEDSYSPNHNGLSPANVWSQIVLQAVSPSNACLVTFHVESDKDLGGGSVFGDDFYFAQQEAVPFIEPTGALLVVR